MAEVRHHLLTGAELHEPKGISEAESGEVYVADGEGSGDWADPDSVYETEPFSQIVLTGMWRIFDTADTARLFINRDCYVRKLVCKTHQSSSVGAQTTVSVDLITTAGGTERLGVLEIPENAGMRYYEFTLDLSDVDILYPGGSDIGAYILLTHGGESASAGNNSYAFSHSLFLQPLEDSPGWS